MISNDLIYPPSSRRTTDQEDLTHHLNITDHFSREDQQLKPFQRTLEELKKKDEHQMIDEKRLVRKLDYRILTCATGLLILNFLDQSNIGNAKVGGMQDELRMNSTQYSIALLIFASGFLVGEIPSNMILSRIRYPSWYIPGLAFGWGGTVVMMGQVKSSKGLIGVRFILGLAESGFGGGIVFYLSRWYRTEELAKRVAVMSIGGLLAGSFGGLIAAGVIESLQGVRGLSGWRWLFIS